MRALTWHGRRDVRVDTVADPVIHGVDLVPERLERARRNRVEVFDASGGKTRPR